MKENWTYYNPVEIHFAKNQIANISSLVDDGHAILITTPGFSKRGVVDLVKKGMGDFLLEVFDCVCPNPTFASIRQTYKTVRSVKFDIILALGGGSTMDTAKAIAAMKAVGSENWLQGHLKDNVPFPEPFLPKPIVAFPTTAGTGSEVTMWATVWDMEEKNKYSISHPLLYPKKAFLDPELTLTLPEDGTVHSGLDCLSHAMEAIWNKNHNPISDTFAMRAISLVCEYLPILKSDLTNLDLRGFLLEASLLAGLAFSNTKTAVAHSISYPLTAYFGLPHGLACALPLPHLLRYNGTYALDRVKIMAESLGVKADIDVMAERIVQLFEDLGVSMHLADYGVSKNELEHIVYAATTSVRAQNNIIELSENDMTGLVESLF